MKIIPPEQIGRYLREAERYGVLPIFYLELASGLRRGETVSLTIGRCGCGDWDRHG